MVRFAFLYSVWPLLKLSGAFVISSCPPVYQHRNAACVYKSQSHRPATRDEVPDLQEMRRGFERSLDGKLVMDYVRELRARKEELQRALQSSQGVITGDIYQIMKELALVNPSGGAGGDKDKGQGHYSAMLEGHWIAASTLVPGVPFVFGEGEASSPLSPAVGTEETPTCALGDLQKALMGLEVEGEFDLSIPVRPLRARLSAPPPNDKDRNTMPSLVATARYVHASRPMSTATETNPEESDIDHAEATAAVTNKVDEEEFRARVEDGARVGVYGQGNMSKRSADSPQSQIHASGEEGAVRARGMWEARGTNHLGWTFSRVDIARQQAQMIVNSEKDAGEAPPGRDLYEFFLDQNMLILAWKKENLGPEDAIVFVRDEMPRN